MTDLAARLPEEAHFRKLVTLCLALTAHSDHL